MGLGFLEFKSYRNQPPMAGTTFDWNYIHGPSLFEPLKFYCTLFVILCLIFNCFNNEPGQIKSGISIYRETFLDLIRLNYV